MWPIVYIAFWICFVMLFLTICARSHLSGEEYLVTMTILIILFTINGLLSISYNVENSRDKVEFSLHSDTFNGTIIEYGSSRDRDDCFQMEGTQNGSWDVKWHYYKEGSEQRHYEGNFSDEVCKNDFPAEIYSVSVSWNGITESWRKSD
ncbi:MAG: hypothetical protein ACTSRU_09060 [Candidatus Hodarchaeales archaeon]